MNRSRFRRESNSYIRIDLALRRPKILAALLWFMLLSAESLTAQEKPVLSAGEYGRWETLAQPVIDPSGSWVATVVTRNDEESELRIAPIATATQQVIIEYGEEPVFSPDGNWVAWFAGAGPDAEEETPRSAELMNLASGERTILGEVAELAFGPASVALAVLSNKDADDDEEDQEQAVGSDLRILSLANDTSTTIGSVSAMVWHDSESLLAMTLGTHDNRGNGLQVYSADTGSIRGMHSSDSRYLAPVWREEAADLLVLRTVAPADEESQAHELLAWRDLSRSATEFVLDPVSADIDADLIVSGESAAWSRDGGRISFRLAPKQEEDEYSEQENAEATSDNDAGDSAEDEQEVATVQIWHSRDTISLPEQIYRESNSEDDTLLAIWNLEANQVVQIGTNVFETAGVLENWRFGFEKQTAAYPWENMFGRNFHDIWLVDLESGERHLAVEQVRYSWESPQGRYLLWYDGEGFKIQEIETGEVLDLTSDIDTTFANLEWDLPVDDFVPPWGVGGWLEGDEAVLIYDQFDVWRVDTDGSGVVRLTDGAATNLVHRMQDLDPDNLAFDEQDLLFATRNEWTEERGFARWRRRGGYEQLVSGEHYFSGLSRAEDADILVYIRESKTDSPDVFVADTNFESSMLILESNPFMDEYAWPTTELIDYRNADGKRLHGTLIYPANYDPALRYPMIVNAYELLTPQTHRWVNPTDHDYYNQIVWAHEGYFVLLPDIVFRDRDPGVSVAETLDAAISAVETRGVIDRNKVGFVGHSWGGYHAAYLGARTDLFAATVSGAPLTDFVSFMGQFHWNTGNPESTHWETGQARMAVPYWEDSESHERNSPLHGVQTMTTPILMAHGDDDGVVEYFQSTVFYNFVRRAGKEMVLLTYEGEDHGFNEKANQIDYHRRILEWFDHYLRGADPQPWITSGVLWKAHEDEKRRIAESR